MDDVRCVGNETTLLDCPHTTQENCGPNEGAGVICGVGKPHFCWELNVPRYFCVDRKTAELTLVGGSGPHEGNIHVDGLPVCDDHHNANNALVICRFVGCNFSLGNTEREIIFLFVLHNICTYHLK